MIYIVTHSYRDNDPDPSHTTSGMLKLSSDPVFSVVSLIAYHWKGVIYVGTGKRFRETFGAFKSVLQKCEVKYSPLFGSEESRRDTPEEKLVVLSDNEEISLEQYMTFADFKGFDAWRILRHLPKGSLILTGRQFCKCLGIESKSCSVYEINPCKKIVACIIAEGVRIRDLSIQ